MRRRANSYVAAVLSVSGLALAAPAFGIAKGGAAGSGGTAPSSGAVHQNSTGSPSSQVKPGDIIVSASGGGLSFATRESGLLYHPQRFTGNAGSGAAGKIVEIQRRGRETGWQWANTTHATVGGNGSFSAVWPTNHIGQFAIRAVLERSLSAHPASASPALTITVYRPSVATLYGPGFYGQRTACGTILRRGTIGVANRTLKCGTPVAIYYAGRTMVVPVIDRGPYAHNADWDLTMATARALGIPGTETIGAVSLPGHH